MRASILGAGLWARGQTSFTGLSQATAADPDATRAAPRPALVPARDLRRLPTPARLAVEVASQACDGAGIALESVLPVFTSAIGDADITDYMCRTLAGEDKQLSPIRFQNSVHNAPAGYLSIASGNTAASSFVSAFANSFALALLEALVLATTQPRAVLLVTTDVPVPGPLADVHAVGELAASALLLGTGDAPTLATLDATVTVCAIAGIAAQGMSLQDSALARSSATLQAWPLLVSLAAGVDWRDSLALGNGSALQLELVTSRRGASG